MLNNDMIPAQDFCRHYHVELAFLSTLQQYGLVEIAAEHEAQYIAVEQLPVLEQMLRLHHDLDINPEGIQAIFHLLERMKAMQEELALLKNRVSLYENE